MISRSPILLREAEGLTTAIWQEARRPASVEQIKSILGSRFALFPQPERTDGEWDMWWADYISALEDLTPAAVEAGMAAWVRSIDAEFMPKPGKLRDLAQKTPVVSRWTRALDRIRKALPPIDTTPAPMPERERMDPETVAELMKDFHAKMKAKEPPQAQKRVRPSPQAEVDETGMSAEMRALLNRPDPAQRAAA